MNREKLKELEDKFGMIIMIMNRFKRVNLNMESSMDMEKSFLILDKYTWENGKTTKKTVKVIQLIHLIHMEK